MYMEYGACALCGEELDTKYLLRKMFVQCAINKPKSIKSFLEWHDTREENSEKEKKRRNNNNEKLRKRERKKNKKTNDGIQW